jgi:NAD(P)-dependent dehydrogenase (short-subunit alcohol dehydrogenase family)
MATEYSIADQVKRFANAKETSNTRYLDISTVYDGSYLKGKRVLVTGGEQNLGLETIKEIVKNGGFAICASRTSTPELDAEIAKGNIQLITGIDVTKDDAMEKLTSEVDQPIDILINNAGYFYGPVEAVGVGREGHLNFKQELLMIDICSVGVLRVTSSLYKAGKLKPNESKVIIITSQAGSCEWRFTQNAAPNFGDEFHGNYGHHMSRASCNVMACILSQEFTPVGIPVQMLHPGFNRTSMTQKYSHIWDLEGAVDASVGAKRVLYETGKSDMSRTGTFINTEDGLKIPW